MKKISKKIVALVTLAMFVLTLVPFAAFAAQNSAVGTATKDMTLYKQADESVKATVNLTVGEKDANKKIYVWLTKDDAPYRYATVTPETVNEDQAHITAGTGEFTGAAVLMWTTAEKTFNVEFTIPDEGVYTVHAGADLTDGATTLGALTNIAPTANYSTITVTPAASHVTEIEVVGAEKTDGGGLISYNGTPNGVTRTPVTAKVSSVYDSDNETEAPSTGKVVTVTNSYSNFTVYDAEGNATNEITVDAKGEANFSLFAEYGVRPGTYTMTLTAENVNYKLSVKIGETDVYATTIEKVDTGATVTERTTGSAEKSLEDVAQFVIKNAAGDILTPETEGIQNFAGTSAYISVEKQPEGAKLTASDFKVVAAYKNDTNFALEATTASKLIVGEYTVRVALDKGAYVDLSFTVANYGKVVETIVEFNEVLKTEPLTLGDVVTEVVDGKSYIATAYQVDENGLKKVVTGASMGYNGSPAAKNVQVNNNGTVTFTVDDDASKNAEDNTYIGAKIGVWAFNGAYTQHGYGEVTVVDPDNIQNYSLAFDPTYGPAGEDNRVKVTVVDEDGDLVKINGTLNVFLVKSAVEDANVLVEPDFEVKNGVGYLTINSNVETDLEVIVGVISSDKDTKDVVFANTLEFAVGAEEVNAKTTVVMTIGSPEYVINNKVLTGDAAPYVADEWRTMVPYRALGEAFGATVEWNNDDRTVSYTLGNTKIVMTIGDTTYTVNGEEKTMDSAPVIQAETSRAFVPVRFVAEALGYSVTPLYDGETGLTASVVFQK